DEAAATWQHHRDSARADRPGRANTGVHHARPPMRGLLPEGEAPGELDALHHALVTAPRVVDDDVDGGRRLRNARKRRSSLTVVGVIAAETRYTGRQVRGVDRAAGREHLIAGIVQRDRNAFADATAGACYESDWHEETFRSVRRAGPFYSLRLRPD